MSRMLVGLGCVVLSFGCGGNGGSSVDGAVADGPSGGDPDAAAAVDAASPDASGELNLDDCPVAYLPASIVNAFSLSNAMEDEAFDLDGDGTGDNQLRSVASLVNDGIAADIESGDFRLMTELRALEDFTLMDDAAVTIVSYTAVDSDNPINPDDDFTGMESFYYSQDSVEAADCSPRGSLPGEIAGGVLTGESTVLNVVISGFGAVAIGNPHIAGQVAPDASGVGYVLTNGRLGGAIPGCPLSMGSAPIGNNQLHALVQFLGMQPDIDLDADGLETIQSDSAGITGCTDGDGTQIAGDTCACDPRIVDGFSSMFNVGSVGAGIIGPDPTP